MLDACAGGVIIAENTWANEIIAACEKYKIKTVVTGYAPVGTVATALSAAHQDLSGAGITVHQVRREFDTVAWPHATKGFFAMKKAIPSILVQLGISR